MKKQFLWLSKIIGLIFFYILIFTASVFITMSYLIKGEEISTPSFNNMKLTEAKETADKQGVYLKEIVGNYMKNFQPNTIIGQIPSPGVKIKKKSYITVFITPDLIEVTVPDLSGYDLKKCVEILNKAGLRRGYISYMDAEDVPVDYIINQSYPTNTKVPQGTEIDILISRGKRNQSYIMPDCIGKDAKTVLIFFENKGFPIARINEISYPGLASGIIINQYPAPGFEINQRSRIGLEVSK